jgi:hypothetical protein
MHHLTSLEFALQHQQGLRADAARARRTVAGAADDELGGRASSSAVERGEWRSIGDAILECDALRCPQELTISLGSYSRRLVR